MIFCIRECTNNLAVIQVRCPTTSGIGLLVQVWRPHFYKDIRLLERVQHRMTENDTILQVHIVWGEACKVGFISITTDATAMGFHWTFRDNKHLIKLISRIVFRVHTMAEAIRINYSSGGFYMISVNIVFFQIKLLIITGINCLKTTFTSLNSFKNRLDRFMHKRGFI